MYTQREIEIEIERERERESAHSEPVQLYPSDSPT